MPGGRFFSQRSAGSHTCPSASITTWSVRRRNCARSLPSIPSLPRRRDPRRQHFLMKAVAADAEILIGLALRRHGARFRDETRLVPAVALTHALGPPRVDRLVHRIAAQR